MIASALGEKGQRYFKVFVERIPIPSVSEYNEKIILEINRITNDIFLWRKENKSINNMEREIDKLVYQLYDLTPQEIAIIEQQP